MDAVAKLESALEDLDGELTPEEWIADASRSQHSTISFGLISCNRLLASACIFISSCAATLAAAPEGRLSYDFISAFSERTSRLSESNCQGACSVS